MSRGPCRVTFEPGFMVWVLYNTSLWSIGRCMTHHTQGINITINFCQRFTWPICHDCQFCCQHITVEDHMLVRSITNKTEFPGRAPSASSLGRQPLSWIEWIHLHNMVGNTIPILRDNPTEQKFSTPTRPIEIFSMGVASFHLLLCNWRSRSKELCIEVGMRVSHK